MPKLHGPKAPGVEFTPPDLDLSPAKREALEVRVHHLLNRWRPQTEDPHNLAREVYELAEWLISEADDPECPILEVE